MDQNQEQPGPSAQSYDMHPLHSQRPQFQQPMQVAIPQHNTHQRQDSGYSQSQSPQTYGPPFQNASQAASPVNPSTGFITQRPSASVPNNLKIHHQSSDTVFDKHGSNHIMTNLERRFMVYAYQVGAMQSQLKQLEKTVVSFWQDINSKLETAGSVAEHDTTKAGDSGDSSKSDAIYACEFGHTVTIQGKVDASSSNQERRNHIQSDQQPEVLTVEQETSPDVFHGSLRQRLDCLAKLVTTEQTGHTATIDSFTKVYEMLQSVLDQFANFITKHDFKAVRVEARHDLELFHIALQEDLETNTRKSLEDIKTLFEESRQHLMCFQGEMRQDLKASGENHDQHDRTRQDIMSLRREIKQGLKLFREEAKQHFRISREETKRDLKTFHEEHNQHLSNFEETRQDLKSFREEMKQDLKTFGERHGQHDEARQGIDSLRQEMKQDFKLFREEAKQHLKTSREEAKRAFKKFGSEHEQHVSNTERRLNECLTNQNNSLVAFLDSEKWFKQQLLSVPDTLKELEGVITTRLPIREDQPEVVEEIPHTLSFAEIVKVDQKPFEGDVAERELCGQMHDQSTQTLEPVVMSHQDTQTDELEEASSNDQGTPSSPDAMDDETLDARLEFRDVTSEGTQTLALDETASKTPAPSSASSVDTNKAYLEMIPLILAGIRDMDQKVSDLSHRVEQQENRASPQEVATLTTQPTARVCADVDLASKFVNRETGGDDSKVSRGFAELHDNETYLNSLASLLRPYMSSTSPSLESSRVPSISASERRAISEEKSTQTITGRSSSQDAQKEARSSLDKEKKKKKQKAKHKVDIKGVFDQKQLLHRASVPTSISGESARGQKVQKRKWEEPEVPRSRADLLQQQQQAYRKKQKTK